jgi:hypothetical protein
MNPELMIVIVVAIVMTTSLIKYGVSHNRSLTSDRDTDGEKDRLRAEIGELKERLKVIERITVEKENSLSKEIESLRDR